MNRLELLYFFKYDKDQGVLIWKNHWRKSMATKLIGQIVGTVDYLGYRRVKINGKKYGVHRLIYFLETGDKPEMIDHIDGDRLNNKISNLRAVTNRKNMQNTYRHREGKLVGANWAEDRNVWRAAIRVGGKLKQLGNFDTELAAHKAYVRALQYV